MLPLALRLGKLHGRCQEDALSQGDAHVCSQAPRHTACAVRCSEEVVHPLERPVLPSCCPFWGS